MNLEEFKKLYQNKIFIMVTSDNQVETYMFDGTDDLKRYIFADKSLVDRLFKLMSAEKGSEFNYEAFSGDIDVLEASLYEKCSREACIRTVSMGRRCLTLDVNQLTPEFWTLLPDHTSLLYAGFPDPAAMYDKVYALINSEA